MVDLGTQSEMPEANMQEAGCATELSNFSHPLVPALKALSVCRISLCSWVYVIFVRVDAAKKHN
jgi:hypothetical protein